VQKRDTTKPIDALIAACLAVWRCAVNEDAGSPWFEVWD
jgi:hypothetical protein